ncbi:MAG: ferrochelatase [Sneathiellaceae bacterium]
MDVDAQGQARQGSRTAIVLLNLGGPDSLDAVRPFLFNLFSDKAIIRLPALARLPLAWLIARRRAPVAREIYAQLGGRSPILPQTEAQAAALQHELASAGEDEAAELRCFIAMRYWHPRAAAAAAEVKAWGADRVLLLPLYPQFSTTTSASSIAEWQREAGRVGLDVATRALCCYPELPGFVAAQADAIVEALANLAAEGGPAPVRLLFSAHGLPKRIVDAGDPYQWQVEATAAALVEAVAAALPAGRMPDWAICYQSRVGRLEWIGPSTEYEVERAGRDGTALIVVPIAFVSEHSETLVELDIEYAELAARCGVPAYRRVATVGTGPSFIDSLAGLVAEELELFGGAAADRAGERIGRAAGRLCPAGQSDCPCGRPLAGKGTGN